MRLCTFQVTTSLGRHSRLGAVTGAGIIDLNFACAWHLAAKGEARPYALADVLVPDDMLSFLQGEETSTGFARATLRHVLEVTDRGDNPQGLNGETLLYAPETVRLQAPLPHPVSLRKFSAFEVQRTKDFERRGEPMPQEWNEMPGYYRGNHQDIIGPDEEVRWPSFIDRFDYALEIGVVIGKAGRNIKAEEAGRYIAGFTVINDFSAGDLRQTEKRGCPASSKERDWTTALGPVLVTTEEIADPYALTMTAKINGEEWSHGTTSALHWKFEDMIALLSMDETVVPGELVTSGTVRNGSGLELDRRVNPGDMMELEIENIGVLRNRVVRN